MNNFEITKFDILMRESINEERSPAQREAMEKDYAALKGVHKLVGKFVPFHKMGGMRYHVDTSNKTIRMTHGGESIDTSNHFDDVAKHSGMSVHSFADFLHRNGATEVDSTGKTVDKVNQFHRNISSTSSKPGSAKKWAQTGPNGFWKMVDA